MNKIQFFDGGMGSMLQANGLKAGVLPETLNITNPELIISIHRQYALAGADIITTNTFGANSLKFDNVEEIITAAVTNARSVDKKVALDVGPLGKLLKPAGELDFDEAYKIYKQVMLAGRFADIILIETMTDLHEIKAAVLAAKENTNLPVFVSMAFDKDGRLLTGTDIETAVVTLEGLGIDAIGMNCGLGPEQMLPFVKKMRSITKLPMIVQPNAGLPEVVDGKTTYNIDSVQFAKTMEQISEFGVSYLGGCCGTTPEHIVNLKKHCGEKIAFIPEVCKRTVVSSYSRTVEIGKEPVIIGERINPTGKKLFKEALRNQDIDYIVKEGLAQKEHGAHILDVNVGLPEIDENEMMKKCVYALQSVTDLPLQIDTSDITAMESALRLYNGKAMLNSVNGKSESMESVFPIAKKYGAVIVCLCLDENGIPKTADGRIEIAKKIIATAKKYEIDKSELVFDALAMTISTDSQSANETLKTLKLLRYELGVQTILGVSNISFGLPNRDIINSVFFNSALENGLSSGIVNPLSESMMNTYYAFLALKGFDKNCENYIQNVSQKAEVKSETNLTLQSAIKKGLIAESEKCVDELLKSEQPINIINQYIMPALDEVGNKFEKGTLFLPQLIMSAESAKAAFEIIKKNMPSTANNNGQKIILATVHGDIHDIGKNIVKVLLENYGYNIIDLGKDVPEEKVLEEVRKNNIKLVGLSALMTTTVPAMEKTIALLHEHTDAKVVVGGAVLTQSYADMINADYYAPTASHTVKIAKEFFHE